MILVHKVIKLFLVEVSMYNEIYQYILVNVNNGKLLVEADKMLRELEGHDFTIALDHFTDNDKGDHDAFREEIEFIIDRVLNHVGIELIDNNLSLKLDILSILAYPDTICFDAEEHDELGAFELLCDVLSCMHDNEYSYYYSKIASVDDEFKLRLKEHTSDEKSIYPYFSTSFKRFLSKYGDSLVARYINQGVNITIWPNIEFAFNELLMFIDDYPLETVGIYLAINPEESYGEVFMPILISKYGSNIALNTIIKGDKILKELFIE